MTSVHQISFRGISQVAYKPSPPWQSRSSINFAVQNDGCIRFRDVLDQERFEQWSGVALDTCSKQKVVIRVKVRPAALHGLKFKDLIPHIGA